MSTRFLSALALFVASIVAPGCAQFSADQVYSDLKAVGRSVGRGVDSLTDSPTEELLNYEEYLRTDGLQLDAAAREWDMQLANPALVSGSEPHIRILQRKVERESAFLSAMQAKLESCRTAALANKTAACQHQPADPEAIAEADAEIERFSEMDLELKKMMQATVRDLVMVRKAVPGHLPTFPVGDGFSPPEKMTADMLFMVGAFGGGDNSGQTPPTATAPSGTPAVALTQQR